MVARRGTTEEAAENTIFPRTSKPKTKDNTIYETKVWL
jgi:hypothetical protein